MTSQGNLGTRQGYLSEMKRLFTAAGHRRNEYKPFAVVFEGKSKARGWDFPGSSVYYPWRGGKSLPSKQYARLFDALVAWLLDLAAAAGDTSFPPRDAWSKALADLHEGSPAGRGDDGRRSAPSDTAMDLARWCTREAARYQAAVSRLPYLEGHPNPEGHNITAHTRLGVRQGSTADRSTRSDPYRLPSDDPGNQSVEMPYLTVVADRKQLVIVGDAGIGKTWLLQHHAGVLAQAAAAHLRTRGSRSGAPIPVLVRADTLADAHQPGHSLAESAVQALALSGSRISKHFASRLIPILQKGAVVYLIDALDETTPDQYAVLSGLLNPLENAHPSTRYVVTTRLASYVGIFHHAQRTEAELLPFESPVPYIDSWELPRDRRAELLQRIAHHRAIAQMARIPLLLAFLCHLAKDSTEAFPDSRAQLYERITRRFLIAEHKPHRPHLKSARTDAIAADPTTRADELLDILQPLAFRIATDANGWLDTIPRRAMLEHLKHVERPRGLSAPAALDLLANDVGILVPTGSASAGRTPEYRFIHRTLAEYLTAAHMAASPKLIEHCARHHLHLAADWHQTWLLCVQLSPADALSALTGHPQDALHVAMNVAALAVGELDEARREEADEQIAALTTAASRLLESTTSGDLNKLAANALGEVGGAAAVASLSRALLAPASKRTRSSAPDELPSVWNVFNKGPITQALARTGHPAAIANLSHAVAGDLPGIETLSEQDFHSLRADAARALTAGNRTEGFAQLIGIVNDPHGAADVRAEALKWLAHCDQPGAINLIVDSLVDVGNDAAVREVALDALIGQDIWDDSVREVRVHAVGLALVAATTGRRPESDTQLTNALIDLFWSSADDEFLRGGTFDVLTSLNSPSVVPTLVRVLQEVPGDASSRLSLHDDALTALGRVKALDSIETLIEVLLGNRELSTFRAPRERAMETLVDVLEGHPAAGEARERAEDALTRICSDLDDPLSEKAVIALVRVGDEATVRGIRPRLMTLLDKGGSVELLEALFEADSPTAAQLLLEKRPLTGDSGVDVWNFFDPSQILGGDELDELLNQAMDPDRLLAARIRACRRLVEYRRSAAIGVLRGIVDTESCGGGDRGSALAALGSACDVPTLRAIIVSSEPDQLQAFASGLAHEYFTETRGLDEYSDLLECLTIANECGHQSLQAAAAAAAQGLRFATVLPRHRTARALDALWAITTSSAFTHPTRLMPGEVGTQDAIIVTYQRNGDWVERSIPKPTGELTDEQLIELAERYGRHIRTITAD